MSLPPHLKINMGRRLPENFYSMQYALISQVAALKFNIFSQLFAYMYIVYVVENSITRNSRYAYPKDFTNTQDIV